MNASPVSRRALELWGGVECTINRVGDHYFDQLERSGHARRQDDLERFASLGIRALRYPVLWERWARADREHCWSWSDERLARLRELDIRPIAGLLHHGSGPPHTSLVDPQFPFELAGYARAAAERYPWIRDWSPVNEPVTTARFSGLYGHWYPHARELSVFVRALLAQCRGIALAMREIRGVQPEARLLLPEEVGRIGASARLAYQAEYENRRRLLALDLLTGRVGPEHPLWRHLLDAGASADELDELRAAPCPPDIVGVNYYLTSDRFLDGALANHPPATHGGNGRDRYADVEAVRMPAGLTGHRALLHELWDTYRIPLAITEVHAGCTREEQLRWMAEAWSAAQAARAEGVEVLAVTAWSLLGSFDWDKLLVRSDGHYEPGVFDVRSSPPRPTALVRQLRGLAEGGSWTHPVLETRGWWRRAERLRAGDDDEQALASATPLLVTGATGTLGGAIARVARSRGLAVRLLSRGEMDIADPSSVERALVAIRPWAVINAAGYVRVADAHRELGRCWRENVLGPLVLARATRARDLPLVTFSSDLVFSGEAERPYVESDAPGPRCPYGATKAEAERGVLALFPAALVIRTAAFFGPWDAHNFVTRVRAALRTGQPVRAPSDQLVSPTYVPDLAHTALDLLIDGERGLWHLVNQGSVSWAELAQRVAALSGADVGLVEPTRFDAGDATQRRLSLTSERGVLLPPLERALGSYFAAAEA